MNKSLLAIVLAASAFAVAPTASATTFPSLTTIYVVSGVFDSGSPDFQGVATSVHCSNVSGQTTQLRFLFLTNAGAVAGSAPTSISHGEARIVSIHDTTYLNAETIVNTGALTAGATLNIESTQSAVFCSAMIVTPRLPGPTASPCTSSA